MTARSTRYIQLGRESTAGTSVAATTVWAGEANKIEDLGNPVWAPEDKGRMSPGERAYVPKLGGRLAIPSAAATFEQIVHVFEAGIETDTPAAEGSGYIYEYNLPTTAANTIKTYTIEAGDGAQEGEMEYGFVTDFSLSGSAGGALNVASTWVGRQLTASTKTASQTVPAVRETILVSKGMVYINDTFGSLGATAVAATILGIDMKVTTGITALFSMDGALYFTTLRFAKPTGMLDLTMEYNATAVAEEAKSRANTGRYVRIQFNGAALGTTGATYTTKALRIDCYGVWDATFKQLDEQDGNDVVTGTLRLLDDGANLFCNLYVCNLLASIP